VDFLLVLIELFSLGVTAEAVQNRRSPQRGPVNPKFQVEGIAPHQLFFFSENWDKWTFVWYKNEDKFRFVKMYAFDRRAAGADPEIDSGGWGSGLRHFKLSKGVI